MAETADLYRAEVIASGGTLSDWQPVVEVGSGIPAALNQARGFHTAHVVPSGGGHVVVVTGGAGGAATLDSVEYARLVDTDGDGVADGVEPFTVDAIAMSTGVSEHDGGVFGSSIYLTGGSEQGGAANGETQRLSVSSGCNAGTGSCLSSAGYFTEFGSVAGARFAHGSVIHLNNLYIFGGYNGSVLLDDAWFIDP